MQLSRPALPAIHKYLIWPPTHTHTQEETERETQNRNVAIKKEYIAYTPGWPEPIYFATFSGSLLLNALAMLGKLLLGQAAAGAGEGQRGHCGTVTVFAQHIRELHVLPSWPGPTLSLAGETNGVWQQQQQQPRWRVKRCGLPRSMAGGLSPETTT